VEQRLRAPHPHHRVEWATIGREVSLAVLGFLVYFGVRGLTDARVSVAEANAERVVRLEEWLGIAHETQWQAKIVEYDGLVTSFNWIYMFGHWPVIAVTAFWLLFTQPVHYRLIRNAFLISGAIGLVIFAVFPVAPPRLFDPDIVDTVSDRSRSYRVLQPPIFVNQYAAMPSLHFGWNLLIGIALVLYAKPVIVRAAGVILPILMFAAVILTANHFILDPLAGSVVALAGLAAAVWYQRRVAQPPPQRPGPKIGGNGMRRGRFTPERPLTVAHRAGNHIALLREAEAIGVDLVEADARWWKGRVEVRHLKTMGPVPLLWDRWKLTPGWTPRLQLEELLPEVGPETELMLDFKPGDEAFSRQVLESMRRLLPGRRYTVCSQFWPLLESFIDEPGVRVVHSVGNGRALRRVLPHLQQHPRERRAISIHRKLLTPGVVAELCAEVPLVMSWPVNTEAHLRELQSWGVNGVISDNMDLLRMLADERRQLSEAEIVIPDRTPR